MVWTRDIDAPGGFGRLNIARLIRGALREHFTLSEDRLHSIVERKRPAAVISALLQFLRTGPLPLQCLLFADPAEIDRAVTAIPPEAGAVYVDGVRCFLLARRLRQLRPELLIVTDLDDLMSRRMRLLLELGEAPTTGYMKRSMPRLVEPLLRSRALSRAVLRYEGATLRRVERRLVSLSDRTVLLSPEDARELEAQCAGAGRVVGIAPPARIVQAPLPLRDGPLRFVFIGSDTLRQNQLTIDRLIDLWRRRRVQTPLVIYGEQEREIGLPEHVTMPGFAQSITDVYDGRSILLSPSYLAGGIKTKVLEAFRYGAAVVGNRVTFEGLDIGDYPLNLDDDTALLPFVHEPDRHRALFHSAAIHGQQLLRAAHDPDDFTTRWTGLFGREAPEHLAQAI